MSQCERCNAEVEDGNSFTASWCQGCWAETVLDDSNTELIEITIKDTDNTEIGFDSEEIAWLAEQPEGTRYLIAEDAAFIGCDHQHDWPKGVNWQDACAGKPHANQLCLFMSDTFAYACSDSEAVHPHQVDEVVSIYKRWGPIGLICWAAKQRNEDPVIEYTEDPVYQETWKGIYGDIRVEKNYFNTVDPRWSDERLNLIPWEPKE